MSYHIVQFMVIFCKYMKSFFIYKKSQNRITPNKVSFNSSTELTEVYYLSKVGIQIFGSLPMGVNLNSQ